MCCAANTDGDFLTEKIFVFQSERSWKKTTTVPPSLVETYTTVDDHELAEVAHDLAVSSDSFDGMFAVWHIVSVLLYYVGKRVTLMQK